MFRQFGLQGYRPGMVPGKRTPAPGPPPKAPKRPKTADETGDSANSKKTVTRHFQASWKWDDEKQEPCRHWLRHDPVQNLMFCDLCIKHEAHIRKNHITGITNNFKFISGSNSFKKSAVTDHEKGPCHKLAVDREDGLQNPNKTTGGKTLKKLNEKQASQVRLNMT